MERTGHLSRVVRASKLVRYCAMGAMLLACGKDDVTSVDRVATVEVSPAETTIPVGSATTLTAAPLDEEGQPIQGQTVHWSSSDNNIATVDGGVVTGRAAGDAQIAATVQGVSAVATIRVSEESSPPVVQPVVTRVSVSPSTAVVRASGNMDFRRVQLNATVYDQNDRVLDGQSVTWTTSSNSKATVNASGLVTGHKEGSVTITATVSGKKGTASIVVVK